MTNDQNKMLWEKLKGVTEFKHNMCGVNDPGNSLYYKCRKCDIDKMGTPLRNSVQTEPCPVPDKYPGSLADIAEDVRVWMEKNEDDDNGFLADYANALTEICNPGDFNHAGFIDWLIFEATPQQKIQAAFKVWSI